MRDVRDARELTLAQKVCAAQIWVVEQVKKELRIAAKGERQGLLMDFEARVA